MLVKKKKHKARQVWENKFKSSDKSLLMLFLSIFIIQFMFLFVDGEIVSSKCFQATPNIIVLED